MFKHNLVRERLLYLAKIIIVINGRTLCVISSISTLPPSQKEMSSIFLLITNDQLTKIIYRFTHIIYFNSFSLLKLLYQAFIVSCQLKMFYVMLIKYAVNQHMEPFHPFMT